MKKYIYILLACAAVFSFAACVENVEINPDENGPVLLNVSMEQPETKATISEAGAFAFSNGDAIKVYSNENSKVFTGTTTSTGNDGTFAMEAGFKNEGTGFAGFPASLVSNITGSGVTFFLPASYEYSEVGADNANTAMVSCPMMGTFTADSPINLKQVGAVVRFQVTNIKEGSLSFTFPTKVTGQATLAAVPSAENEGILATSFPTLGGGKTITISNVPNVTSGNYIYITIPVPTGTAPEGILVVNDPSDASGSRMQSIAGSSTALNRASGRKISVSPTDIPTPSFKISPTQSVVLAPGNLMAKVATCTVIVDPAGTSPHSDMKKAENVVVGTASNWKFSGSFEFVGSAKGGANDLFANGDPACVGQWIDLFSWQGASVVEGNRYHGMVSVAHDRGRKNTPADHYTEPWTDTDIPAWHGDVVNEDLYSGCWDGLTIDNGGSYTWRTLSKDEWNYILFSREGATLSDGETTENNARFSRATVDGVNGLLIFPDGMTWVKETMGALPDDINCKAASYGWTRQYTAANMVAMANAGIVFLPSAGCASGTGMLAYNTIGYYWTNSGSSINTRSAGEWGAYYINVHYTQATTVAQYARNASRSVRLARDVSNGNITASYDGTWTNTNINE